MDHQTLARIASDEDIQDMWYTPEDRTDDRKTVQELLKELPDEEQELYELWFVRGVKQQVIADLFGMNQSSLNYRIQRLASKLKTLHNIPTVDWSEVRKILPRRLVRILDLYLKHGSRKKTYQCERISQQYLNESINEILSITKEEYPEAHKYIKDIDTVKRQYSR